MDAASILFVIFIVGIDRCQLAGQQASAKVIVALGWRFV
jgi:hypothetical protein